MSESRRTRMTKRIMKDTLLQLMEKKPLCKISVTELCGLADVNRSTFYTYYDETVDLLREIENEIFEQMPTVSNINEILDDSNFFSLNTEFFEYIRRNVKAFRILLVDSESNSFQNRMTDKVIEMYKWNDDEQDERFCQFRCVYFANGAIGMLKEWIRQDFPISSGEFAKLIMDIATYNAEEGGHSCSSF